MYVLVISCCTAYTSQLAWNYEFDFGILNNVDNISSMGWIPAGFKINIFLSHQPACTFEATSAILPFKYIKNTNPDQCMTPLEGGATHSRLTLEPFDLNVSALSITTTVSGGDTCDRFGTTVVVEMQHDQNMPILRECALVQKTEWTPGVYNCSYSCLCTEPCAYVHFDFHSLKNLAIENTPWALCLIKMCLPESWLKPLPQVIRIPYIL